MYYVPDACDQNTIRTLEFRVGVMQFASITMVDNRDPKRQKQKRLQY